MGGRVLVILVLGARPAHPAPEGGRGKSHGQKAGQASRFVGSRTTTLYGARKYIAL